MPRAPSRDYSRAMTPLAREILDFWFGPPPHAARAEWFRKDPAFDAAIRARFGARDRGRARRRVPRLARRRRAARSRACCCSTSSRATPFATRRARSPATPQALATAIAVVDAGRDARSTATSAGSSTCRSSTPRTWRCRSARSRSSRALARRDRRSRAARVGREACGDRPPLRPLSAPQRDPRPRVDAGGDRVPAGAGVALLADARRRRRAPAGATMRRR